MEEVVSEGGEYDTRGEEKWSEKLEVLASDWRDACTHNSKRHDLAGYKARMKHLILGLPAPIATIVTGAVSALWESPDARYFIVPVMGVTSILGLVHTYLNMGGKAQRHWDFAARYGGIVSKIDMQMVRGRKFRSPADAFMAETRVEVGNLNANAPQLPGRGCCGCTDVEEERELVRPEEFIEEIIARREREILAREKVRRRPKAAV